MVSRRRVVQNLLCSGLHLHRHFPKHLLDRIEHAIAASEVEHRGEIRFAVETALDIGPLLRGQTARNRAIDVFARLRVWDTEQNNGVLIYLLLAERDIEIVADRGIADKVPPHEWEAICRAMEQHLREERFAVGILAGIEAVSALLTQHFPSTGADRNELPNQPVVL